MGYKRFGWYRKAVLKDMLFLYGKNEPLSQEDEKLIRDRFNLNRHYSETSQVVAYQNGWMQDAWVNKLGVYKNRKSNTDDNATIIPIMGGLNIYPDEVAE